MKKYVALTAFLVCFAVRLLAQTITVDQQSGLVTKDGVGKFYLIVTNKSILTKDFILENINHEQLAYLKFDDSEISNCKDAKPTNRYIMHFSKSGSYCYIDGFSVGEWYIKHIGKEIAKADLVKEGKINRNDEQRFVVLHNGFAAVNPYIPANISLNGNKIYNNSEWIGTFNQNTDAGVEKITFYDTAQLPICSATHQQGNDNDDWNVDYQKSHIAVRYNKDAPVEKLSSFLVDKGIF